MLILINDRLILITGQYGLKPKDTVIMPYSGEFGINYEVLRNNNYKLFNSATGAVLEWTAEQLEEPATYDYNNE